MNLSIDYHAVYAYEEAVSLSPHVVRLFPRDVLQVRVESFAFATNDGAQVHWRRDLYDNPAACCFYPREEAALTFSFQARITTVEQNPFGFLLESRSRQWPARYDARELALLAAYFDGATGDWPAALQPTAGADTIESLVAMNSWIYDNIAYERREEGEAFPPAETLRRARGACRDTAVLLAAVLRSQGLAARLASGYLWESASDPAERKADSALHAWTEVYLPGAGWVGCDPSNGVLVDHHYLTAAVGLVPEDVAPVAGLYFGDRTVPHRLDTTLRITRA